MGDPDPKEEVKNIVPVDKPEEINPAKEVTPPPVSDPADTKDDLRDMVSSLSEKVEELTGLVAGIVEKGDPDTSPVKPPWNERKLF